MEEKNQIEIIYNKNLDEYQINNNDLTIFVKDYNIILSESNNNMGYLNLLSDKKTYCGNVYFDYFNIKTKNHNILNHFKDKISYNIFKNLINKKLIEIKV